MNRDVTTRNRSAESTRQLESLADPPADAQEKCAGQGSEAEYVALLVARDRDAWSGFVAKYESLIRHRIAAGFAELNLPWDDLRAEDICSEIVLTLLKNECQALKRFEGRCKFSTWLSVIARRVCLSVLIKYMRERKGKNSDVDLDRVVQPGSEICLVRELRCDPSLLASCMSRLSTNDRQVLVLYFWKGLSYGTIAEEIGLSENAIGPKLHRARRRLKKLIDEERLSPSAEHRSTPESGGSHASFK